MNEEDIDLKPTKYFDSKECIERLKQLRQIKGYSQKEIAEKIRMEVSGYNKLEKGITSLTFDRFMAILKALEIPFPEFFSADDHGLLVGIDSSVEVENDQLRLEIEKVKLDNEYLTKKVELLEKEIEAKDNTIQYWIQMPKRMEQERKKQKPKK